MTRQSGVNERLKCAINIGKKDKAEQVLAVLKCEIMTVLKSYMDIVDGEMTAQVDSDGETGYRFTFSARADTLFPVGIPSSMLD